MSQYILIDHIKVQDANEVAGFTWGFPAITNFLGFKHNLSRKLCSEKDYMDISLKGCAVVAHEYKVHTYWAKKDGYRFVQTRNPPYLHGIGAGKKSETSEGSEKKIVADILGSLKKPCKAGRPDILSGQMEKP